MGMLREIVVYLGRDYSINESIYVSVDLTKEEITKEIDNTFDYWFSYDIL